MSISGEMRVLTYDEFNDYFWSNKIIKNECWIWQGPTTKSGYGSVFYSPERRVISAHRLAYELYHKTSLPSRSSGKGIVIMHICDNPTCFNPKHLKAGTYKMNTADARSKGRLMFGVKDYCLNGHPRKDPNLYYWKNSRTGQRMRVCRKCYLDYKKKYWQKKKLAKLAQKV